LIKRERRQLETKHQYSVKTDNMNNQTQGSQINPETSLSASGNMGHIYNTLIPTTPMRAFLIEDEPLALALTFSANTRPNARLFLSQLITILP
jgi:hypothetical protein